MHRFISSNLLKQVYYRSYSGIKWSEVHPYNAVRAIVDSNTTERELRCCIDQWREEGRSAVWLHVPVADCSFLHRAVGLGFTLHHTSTDEVVLNQWLDVNRPNKIPPFASHQVGVCGVVIRKETKEILVTQDKYKLSKWKFPGGISEFAEDIANTAEREVLEETGIVAKFQSVLAFRQHHNMPMAFNQSDLYFICRMDPLSYDITPCGDEVLKCEWLPIRELQLSPSATQLTNRIAEVVLDGLEHGFDKYDICCEQWPSILPGQTYDLFMRTPSNNNT